MLIGHASQDENKKASGGAAGNQTGKELCTRSWYNKPWDYVLRCTDPSKAEKMAKACQRACANLNIGYDQSQRNTLRTQAIVNGYNLALIKTPCECDCSSFMTVCAECAGIAIPYSGSNAPTTSTMVKAFTSTGQFTALTDKQYTTACDKLKRGDILVAVGKHTVMVLEDGINAQISVASIPKKSTYAIGNVYTTNVNLNIRTEPYGEKMKFECITKDAKNHSKFDSYGNAILQKGTRVTCVDIKELTASTWLLIPSGWICAVENGKVYIS